VRGLPRYAARRDNAEGPIVEALEACGFTVEQISKKDVPDLLIGRAGITRVVEVKTDDRPLSPGQVRWWGAWNGNGAIVLRTVDDVEKLSKYWALLDLGKFFASTQP
jgi:hypothetical protein